jgi:hypothetical protein
MKPYCKEGSWDIFLFLGVLAHVADVFGIPFARNFLVLRINICIFL